MKQNTDYEYDTLLSAYELLCHAWWNTHRVETEGNKHLNYPLGLFYDKEATEQEKKNYDEVWWAWVRIGDAKREIYRAMTNKQREQADELQDQIWKKMMELEKSQETK